MSVHTIYTHNFSWPLIVTFAISGGKNGIINPLVHNMAPAYDAAKYKYIWISTSRIKGESNFASFTRDCYQEPLVIY